MASIRVEEPTDGLAVRAVNERAFEEPTEADLVDELRRTCRESLSLVAVDDIVVGHILFTPAVVSCPDRRVVGMGLAPIAVAPEYQRRGIGSALVRRGLEMLNERGCPFVIVLGHPGFYPRFGFRRASALGLSCQLDGIPDEALMVLILDAQAMEGVSGVAKYRDEFGAAV